ncbi:MAG TPA: hypothetical protein VLA96_09085 [Terriglobales bacterium]|nr:hypothetical protein [Terriglobales bacterium]
MKRMKAFLLVMAMVAGMGTLALAHDEHQDRDRRWGNDRNADAQEYGYHNGYRDGFRHGQQDRYQRAGYDYRDRNFKRGDRGYESYMGPRGQYRKGFREGYREGYDDAYYGRRSRSNGVYGRNGQWSVWDRDGDGDVDRDDARYRDRDYRDDRNRDDRNRDDRYARGNGNAQRFGYQDGQQAGQRDRQSRHSYRPTEWEAYKDADHGMSSSSGYRSADDYKREYRQAFMEGYNQAYGRR